MKRKLNSIIKNLRQISIIVFLYVFSIDNIQAQTPYCSAKHNSTVCSKYEMYIGSIIIKEATKIIFNKTNDGCNQSGAPNYTLMSKSPSFSLHDGCSYQMSFSTGNIYNVQVGVWIDLNRDNDFADTGEYVSKGWADIVADGKLQSRTFDLKCGGLIEGSTRMRIRTDSAGSTKWNPSSSCTDVKYGETEDYTINLNKYIKPATGYSMPDTIYVGVPAKFISNHKGCFSSEWDMNDDGATEYTTIDAIHLFNTPGRHCVRLKNSSCSGREEYINCFTVLAPSEIKVNLLLNEIVKIYPNPSSGILNIISNISANEYMEVKVYNSLGSIVFESKPFNVSNGIQQINLGTISGGLYSLTITCNGKQLNRLISISRR